MFNPSHLKVHLREPGNPSNWVEYYGQNISVKSTTITFESFDVRDYDFVALNLGKVVDVTVVPFAAYSPLFDPGVFQGVQGLLTLEEMNVADSTSNVKYKFKITAV